MENRVSFFFGLVTGSLVVFLVIFFTAISSQREGLRTLALGHNTIQQTQNKIVSVMVEKHPELAQSPQAEE